MTPTQRKVFEIIERRQPIARRHIAEMLDMKKSSLSNHLDELRANGHIVHTGKGSLATWSVPRRAVSLPPSGDIFSAAAAMVTRR